MTDDEMYNRLLEAIIYYVDETDETIFKEAFEEIFDVDDDEEYVRRKYQLKQNIAFLKISLNLLKR